MFNQDSATINMNVKADPYPSNSQAKEASELNQVYDRLGKLNTEYSSILYEVEEKLHSIKSLRSPEKGTESVTKDNSNNDFISAISQQLEMFSAYNSRLQKVLKHCSSII